MTSMKLQHVSALVCDSEGVFWNNTLIWIQHHPHWND